MWNKCIDLEAHVLERADGEASVLVEVTDDEGGQLRVELDEKATQLVVADGVGGEVAGRPASLVRDRRVEVDVEHLLAANRAIAVVPNPDKFMTELAHNLLEVWQGDEKNRPVNWSLGALSYEIVK